MRKIAIYGCGGLGKDISVIIDEINKIEQIYDFIGYFDDNLDYSSNEGYLGGIKELNSYTEEIDLVLAFGSSNTLFSVRSAINSDNISFPNLIHPDAIVDKDTLEQGEGNVINAGTVIGRDVVLGDFNIINSNCIIGHDVKFNSYNVVSPQVAVSGNVQIHSKTFLGLNCSIVQGVIIEDEVSIGAKSLILKKAKKGRSYFGIPAVIIKKT